MTAAGILAQLRAHVRAKTPPHSKARPGLLGATAIEQLNSGVQEATTSWRVGGRGIFKPQRRIMWQKY